MSPILSNKNVLVTSKFSHIHAEVLLVESLVGPCSDDVVHGADALHLVLQELPHAHRILTSVGAQHFVPESLARCDIHTIYLEIHI